MEVKNGNKFKRKLEVVECFMISKLKNKEVFVVKCFDNDRIVCPSFSNMKKFVNKELNKLKK